MKRVVIVGGGYAGTALAHALDAVADVVLVEPRDRFVHNVAAIRAVVQPELFEQIAIPYDRLLKRGRVVRGRAVSVTGKSVTLADGRQLDADIVVVATGSHYANPFKPRSDDTETMRTALIETHKMMSDAKSIAIVGAGAVGTELAGEIATAMQGKRIALLSATPTLFPFHANKLGSSLAGQLRRIGVTLHAGVTATSLTSTETPHAGALLLSTGERLTADVIFPAIGAKPEATVLQSTQGVTFGKLGRANVDGWLRPSAENPTLFAIGDAAATGDGMTVVGVRRQQPWLTKAIKAVLTGTEIQSLAKYTPWPVAPILIPLGPRDGASVLPLTKSGLVAGPFLTAAIKGKRLFIPQTRKELGRT